MAEIGGDKERAMKWFFVSNNTYKFEELAPLCAGAGINLIHLSHNTRERQLAQIEDIVAEKAVEAFKLLRSNVLVDHSGLEMDCLKALPGGLTQMFWDLLEDRLVTIAGSLKNNGATAVTALGFCNGRKVWTTIGRLEGMLAPPSGTRSFQWDAIFVPKGSKMSYSAMSVGEKNRLSQRRDALMRLIKQLEDEHELK